LRSYCLSSHISEQTLEVSSTWTNARRDASDYGPLHLLKCHGEGANGLTDVKRKAIEVPVHCQLQLNTLTLLNVPIVKNLNDWVWTNAACLALHIRLSW